jgi:membrane-bound lytic murein transglycosylase B
LALLLAVVARPALTATLPFPVWLEAFKAEALSKGIDARTVETALAGVEPIARVIELDRKQPESTMTFAQYQERVVTASRIAAGRERFLEHQVLLRRIGDKFGVQPRYIVALWGIESDFGRHTGGFSVIASLATLAHDGRRSAYFRAELLNALKILEAGHIGLEAMTGSWAGAMGQSQFMPSSFLNFAYDFDGDGRRDIWTTPADVFASAANYLARSGWRDDQTWGRQVRLPDGFDAALAGLKITKYLDEWQRLGVRRVDGADLPTRRLAASLIRPEKSGAGPAYLVYRNYRTILKWNRSNYFALAVSRLSDAIAGR